MEKDFKAILDGIEDLQVQIRNLAIGTKPFLTFKETCTYFGFKPSTLYKYSSKNAIPGISRPGGKLVYFDRLEVENWIKSSRIKTISELTNGLQVGSKRRGYAK